MMKKILCLLIVTALPVAAQQAATITGDNYQAQGSVDGFSFGPHNFVADSIEKDLVSSFSLKWVDEDSFDVFVEGPGADFDFFLTLSGLDFNNGSGQRVDIVNAFFNENDSDYSTFFASPGNPSGAPRPVDPIVTSALDSVTVNFGAGWTDQLSNDFPTLRFDVQVVPESTTFMMSLMGMCAVVFLRQRK